MQRSAGVTDAASDDRTLRVLIADDEEAVRLALRRFFTRRGWETVEAADGAQARELLAEDAPDIRFDLLICDLRMPRFSGFDLYEWLRSSCPLALERLVLASGDTSTSGTAEWLEDTRCKVLPKPFELPTLRDLADAAKHRAA
jgi:two-component system response regulator PilR (NtrC family)